MAKYQTTFGRPRNFKLGEVNIKVGKHPVEIPEKYASRIQEDYPGWIVRVSEETETLEPVQEVSAQVLEISEEETTVETETLEPVQEPVTESKPKKTTKKAAKI